MRFRRKRKTHTEKLVARLERAISRDLGPTFGQQQDGWLVDRHRRYLHAVGYAVSGGEVTVTLRPADTIYEGNYVEGEAA
jgi:hypothetical protein